jgi:hypothetical protein
MSTKVRVLLVAILIVWGILLTAASLSSVNRFRLGLAALNRADHAGAKSNHRVAHLASFGFLAFLLVLLCRSPSRRIVALAAVIALGALIELLQHLIYSTPLETWDIRDDSYGALGGFVGATLLTAIIAGKRGRAVE